MNAINRLLDSVRAMVRSIMKRVAAALNRLTGGRLTPNTVTVIGLIAHVPIAWLIATGQLIPAAALLVIFGLFDALDGELARLQKKVSPAGMLLDASTDRFKEVMLYIGAAYLFIASGAASAAVWAVAACGASLCVSYVKAKGETAITHSKLTASEVNRLFQDGFLRFELRMFLLVVGLLFNILVPVIIIIAILSGITAVQRLIIIGQKLNV